MDRERGNWTDSAAVKALIKKEPSLLTDITDEQLEELMLVAQVKRDLRRKGVRGDNVAAAADAVHTLKHLSEEVCFWMCCMFLMLIAFRLWSSPAAAI